MCGIYGIIGSKNAVEQVFLGLKDIEYRGYDSWGIAYPVNDSFKIFKKIGFLPPFLPKNSTLLTHNSELALGHTRWATHGGVTEANSHPHASCNQKLVLVHNGIVDNYLELKKSLKKHKFLSETDSEVIIHAIEQEYQGDLAKAVSVIFNKLEGLSAIVVSDGTQIVACRRGSPLVVGQTEDGFGLASDPNALLPVTRKLLFLEDDQMVIINRFLTLINLKTMETLQPEFVRVNWDHTSSTMGKYKHFMLKEMSEQPQVLRNIASNIPEIKRVSQMIKDSYGTFFVGCGTASYACLAGIYLFSKFAHRHVNFSIGSEFNYNEDYLTPKSLLIAVSQSGETIDIIEPVQTAKQKGSKIVALTNVLGSTLYRLSDYPLLLQAGPEKAVASTKALISMFANLIMLSHFLAGLEKQGLETLEKSAVEAEKILKNRLPIKKLATKIYKSKNIYILGRGLSYPVALESALKIKEISYIHAEGFAGGELKHGVIALIEKGTPVIVFVPEDETKEAIISNAMEVKARGGFIIGVSAQNNPVFDYFYKVADSGVSSIIPNTVFSQLLAYHLSVKLGYNPDKPRNLAKSVVVR